MLFTVEQSWKMTEAEKALALIREVELWRLYTWDGCCCGSFDIRGIDVVIRCGKGDEPSVWLDGYSQDYLGAYASGLVPIMDEIVRQLEKNSGRGPGFVRHFERYKFPHERAKAK